MPGHPFENGFDLRLVPEKLRQPFEWAAPRVIFVNSMSDLFHERVSDEYIERVVRVMVEANWHTYQVLTKRGARMAEMLNGPLRFVRDHDHIWWGVSVENRKHGVPRIAELRSAAVSVRFLSIEPLLEDLGDIDLTNMDWVIVGGESGHGARPMEADWVRSLRRQCADAAVPFFFKQWGGVRKNTTGRELDGRTYSETPSVRSKPVPSRRHRQEMMDTALFGAAE